MGYYIAPLLLDAIITDKTIQERFSEWVAEESLNINRKRNRLAFANIVDLKIGGSSRAALTLTRQRHGYFHVSSFIALCRSLCSTATLYRRLASMTEMKRDSLCAAIREGSLCVMHWVDNYAKFYRASSMHFSRELQRNCYWTAHGVKVWPGEVDLRHIDAADGAPISAMPFLDELLSQELHDVLERTLQTISTVATRDFVSP